SNTRNQSDRHAETSHQSHFKNSTTENNKTFNRKHRSKNDCCRNSDYIIPFKKLLQYKMNLLCIMEVFSFIIVEDNRLYCTKMWLILAKILLTYTPIYIYNQYIQSIKGNNQPLLIDNKELPYFIEGLFHE